MSWLEEQYKNTQQTTDGRVGGKGLGAFLWQQFVDEDKLNKESQKGLNQQTAIKSGVDITELDGITDTSSAYDVSGAVIKLKEKKAKGIKDEDRTYARTVTSDNQKPLMAQIAQQTKSASDQLQLAREQGNNTMEMTRLQMAQADKNRLADRADARDARADDLMFRRETMERADRKEERNRRRDSIAALTAGLASLGAAFAL